ncbi:MAG: glycosyltransferase family 2 protein [Candidatus Omnitrophica bacterium]|nr:glycosyltransferase family 2 protein [Candidatus Omnitrophota bacterium]
MENSLKSAGLDISIVIVTCNSEKFIKPCLNSVFEQAGERIEIILVDNGSVDKTIAIARENFSSVAFIKNTINLGAAEARNQGIGVARGKWVLALDCDIVLEDSFLSNILNEIKILPDTVGMLQPKVLNFDKKTIYSCGIYLSWQRRFYDIGSKKHDLGQFDKLQKILGPCSAAGLYRRKMLDELKEDTGYFDRRFFFLVEDVDLAWRAQRRDWKCLLVPDAVCYHHGNSSRLNAKIRQFLSFRNRYFMIRKNENALCYLAKIIPFFLYDLPRFCYLILTNRYLRKHPFRDVV